MMHSPNLLKMIMRNPASLNNHMVLSLILEIFHIIMNDDDDDDDDDIGPVMRIPDEEDEEEVFRDVNPVVGRWL
jgi:hypothetical protein